MEKQEFLDFGKISQEIPFAFLLNHLNIPFEEKKKELKTDSIIVNTDKNLFIYKGGKKGGGPINYYADLKNLNLRDAAKELKKIFLPEEKPLKKDIPTLTLEYGEDVEKLGISKEMADDFEIGKPKGKTVLAGCVCFRIYGKDNTPQGYVGHKDGKWIFPKGSKRGDLVYNLNRANTKYVILVSDILECLHLIKLGFPYAVALMSFSATDGQIEALTSTFQRILVIHKEPQNIAMRLSKSAFVKAVSCDSVGVLNYEQVKAFF